MSSSQHPTLVLRGSALQYTLLTCQFLTQLFSRLIYICVFCRICPIFQISNVTGENMDLLKMFLNLLSSRSSFKDHEPAEFQIDDTYSVPVSMLSVSVYIFMFPLSQRSDFLGEGCRNGSVWDHVTRADSTQRHFASWTRPFGRFPLHHRQIHSPQEDACERGPWWTDGLFCSEKGMWCGFQTK